MSAPRHQYVFRHWNGQVVPVADMFDIFGDETNDPDEAHTVVVFLGPGRWQAITDCASEEFLPRTLIN